MFCVSPPPPSPPNTEKKVVGQATNCIGKYSLRQLDSKLRSAAKTDHTGTIMQKKVGVALTPRRYSSTYTPPPPLLHLLTRCLSNYAEILLYTLIHF